jgi:voltage-gated potassium channel Kch
MARWSRREIVFVIFAVALAISTIAVGILGFRKACPNEPWFVWTHQALQLLVLNGPQEYSNEEIKVAAALGAIVAFASLLKIASFILSDSIANTWLRVGVRDHVVIVGLGSKGIELARQLSASTNRLKLVGIDVDEYASYAKEFEALGGKFVRANGADRSVLELVGVSRCRAVLCLCGEDSTNLDIADLVNEIAPNRTFPIYLHFSNPTSALLMDHCVLHNRPTTSLETYVLDIESGRVKADWDVVQAKARELIPLMGGTSYRPFNMMIEGFKSSQLEFGHDRHIVIGCGPRSRAWIFALAQHESQTRHHVLVHGPTARQFVNDTRRSLQLTQWRDRIVFADPDDSAELLPTLGSENSLFTQAIRVVLVDDESAAPEIAMQVQGTAGKGTTTFSVLKGQGLTNFIGEEPDEGAVANLQVVNLYRHAAKAIAFEPGHYMRLVNAFYQVWIQADTVPEVPRSQILPTAQRVNFFLSCLRVLGFEVVSTPPKSEDRPDDAILERLTVMEHERWRLLKLCSSEMPGERRVGDSSIKRYLVPWDDRFYVANHPDPVQTGEKNDLEENQAMRLHDLRETQSIILALESRNLYIKRLS